MSVKYDRKNRKIKRKSNRFIELYLYSTGETKWIKRELTISDILYYNSISTHICHTCDLQGCQIQIYKTRSSSKKNKELTRRFLLKTRRKFRRFLLKSGSFLVVFFRGKLKYSWFFFVSIWLFISVTPLFWIENWMLQMVHKASVVSFLHSLKNK